MEVGDEEISEAMLGVMYDYYLEADPADVPEVREAFVRCVRLARWGPGGVETKLMLMETASRLQYACDGAGPFSTLRS